MNSIRFGSSGPLRPRRSRAGRGALLLGGQPGPVGQPEQRGPASRCGRRPGLEVQRLGARGDVAGDIAVVVDALGPLHEERRVVLVLLHHERVLRAGLVGNVDLHLVGGTLGDLLGDLPVGLVLVVDRLARRGLLSLSFCIPSVPLIRMVGELDSGKAGLSAVICPATTGKSLSA